MKNFIIIAVLCALQLSAHAQAWSPSTYNSNWQTTYRLGETAIGTTANSAVALRVSNDQNFAPFLFSVENTSGEDRSAISVAEGSFTDNNFAGVQNFEVRSDGRTFIGTSQFRVDQDAGTYPQPWEGMLWVNGRIITSEVLVKNYNFWPDYVFHSDYKLQSLDNLKSFIDANGHLPGIPSAAEIEKNKGFDLGDMTVRQMGKIEELSLYAIEADARINTLQEELAALRKLANELLTLINDKDEK